MKKLFIAVCCTAALVASAVASAQTVQEKLDALKAKGIFDGMPDGQAQLDENMTRAEFARVAALILGLEGGGTPPTTPAFTDVAAGHWYTETIEAATQTGLIEGSGSGTFNPGDPVTVEQLASMLANVLGLELDNAQVDGSASDWAKAYIAAVMQSGFIPIQDDYTQQATREQLVESAYGASGQLGGSTPANEQAIDDAVAEVAAGGGSGPGGPGGSEWLDFPFYSDGAISPSAPAVSSVFAVYEGRMAGQFGNGDAVGAALWTCFDLSQNTLDIRVDFSSGESAAGVGRWSKVNDITGTFSGSYSPSQAVTGSLNGAFYGPTRQEIGGVWDMSVVGEGNASGKFGAELTGTTPK